MRKAVCLFTLIVAVISLFACNKNQADKNVIQMQNDSLAVDTMQAEYVDVKELNNFKSSDLTLFGLHGHVKKVIEKTGNFTNVIEFSTDGTANIKSFYGTDCNVKRDANGRITSIGTVLTQEQEGFYYELKYNANGTLSAENEVHPSWFCVYETKYLGYNANGWPVKSKMFGGEGGQGEYCDLILSYPETDEVGNWTVRTERGEEYVTDETGEDNVVTYSEKVNRKSTRTIEYYTQEELLENIPKGEKRVAVNGKTYSLVNNRISFNGDMPYKLVLGNVEELDQETIGFIASDIESAKVMANLLRIWNKHINTHDVNALMPLYYEEVVKYYASFCDPSDVKECQKEMFAKYPAYQQRIANVEVDPNNAQITFTKYVKTSSDAEEKSYSCYFNVIGDCSESDNHYQKVWIIKESDKLTDANVERKEKSYPRVKLNKNWTVNQLFCGNVGKILNFQIWDFWTDGDDHDYPLLDKISVGVGRDSFDGAVQKHYKGKKNLFYCEGTTSGAPAELYHNAWWHLIWRYNATTGIVEQFGY